MLVFNIKVGDSLEFSDSNHNGSIDFISIDTSRSPRCLGFNVNYKGNSGYFHLKEFSSMNLPIGNDFHIYVDTKHLTPTKASFIIKPLQGMKFTYIKGGVNERENKKNH